MSHEITANDKQQGRSQAWHGLTEILPVILLAKCWLAQWDVKKTVLGIMNAAGQFIAGEYCQLVCTDNESLQIGKPVHCDTYHVLTNKSFLNLVQSVLDGLPGAIVESVGSVCNRSRIFVSLKLAEQETTVIAAGREFKFFLNFLSSHDSSAPFVMVWSSICTVCNNTFGANLETTSELKAVIKHTKNMQIALADIPKIAHAFFVSVQKFAETMDKLAEIPCTAINAKNFFAGLLTEHKDVSDEGYSTRTENQINRLTVLFATGKGNLGANYADVFSAVTDYYSHESAGGTDNPQKQIESSEFGAGQTMKAFAYACLQDDKRIAELIAKGQKAIASRESFVKAQESAS